MVLLHGFNGIVVHVNKTVKSLPAFLDVWFYSCLVGILEQKRTIQIALNNMVFDYLATL